MRFNAQYTRLHNNFSQKQCILFVKALPTSPLEITFCSRILSMPVKRRYYKLTGKSPEKIG